MRPSLNPVSLMLIYTFILNISLVSTHSHFGKHVGYWRLAGRDQLSSSTNTHTPSSTTSASSDSSFIAARSSLAVDHLSCTQVNGTKLVADSGTGWVMICDIDFFGQDIFPFISSGSFESCLNECDNLNRITGGNKCAGFVFAPDRVGLENDCYLKSSLTDVVSPSTIHLVGATLLPISSATSASVVTQTVIPLPASSSTVSTSTSSSPKPHKGSDISNANPFSINSEATFEATTDKTSKHYISHELASPIKLSSKVLQPGINLDLINSYPLASDTGSWTKGTVPENFEMGNMSSEVRFSRDGGKGGKINGTNIVYFCDTATFSSVDGPMGYMNGFVSSSASIDVTKDADKKHILELFTPMGQFQDDVGRLRGWIPMTQGEEAFNIAISGKGYRYAAWPQSSLIPLNHTNSLIYAALVYVEVDMQNQQAGFTSLGNTLISVTMDPDYGPHANRVVNQMFGAAEVQWGTLGGIRAWTASGPGSNDGIVYLFGAVEGGVLVAKVPATEVTDRSRYSYWDGKGWTSTIQGKDSQGYLINQPVMDMDVFYVPVLKTFFMVYLTPMADNTFYIRRLRNVSPIIPPYEKGGSSDYVEQMLQYPWSDPIVLKKMPTPAEGYIYAGGVHVEYFGKKDLANGGLLMLLTWTEHTQKDPDDPSSGYALKTMTMDLHPDAPW